MAVYDREQGLQSIVNAALGEYRNEGFHLAEVADHVLELRYEGKLVGRLNQSTATIPVIHEACREHLESLSAG